MPYAWLDGLLDFVLSPALWMSVLLSVIYALLFTVWRGGGWRQAPKDIVAALVGFAAGQYLSGLMHLDLLRVGEVRLLGATFGAVIGLLAGRLIAQRLSRRTPALPAKGRTSG